MKILQKIKVHVLVSIIILFGMSSVGIISYNTYRNIIMDDIRNISTLTATNIYSEISNQLTKPIFVSLTMANDSFLENWLKEEENNDFSFEHQQKLTEYLKGLYNKYGYNSVFLVSEYTKKYYHFNGINKVISEDNQHDLWYFNYLKSKMLYDLDVDTDEANQNKLSVFINCRVEDNDGNLLGVTGVGLQINKMQELLKHYKDDFHLDAMLFDKTGIVQIHSNLNLIEKENLFADNQLKDRKSEILNNKDSIAVFNYKDNKSEGYMITRYIEDLDWYLMVKKDTSVLEQIFYSLLLQDFLICAIVLFIIIFIIIRLIKNNDKTLLRMAKTDTLTGLSNRRGFDEVFQRIIRDTKGKEIYSVFVLDIDNLKKINDFYGHQTGDDIIYKTGNIVSECMKENGDVFRWGGDEFTGFIYGDNDKLNEVLNHIFDLIRNDANLKQHSTTISMGIAKLQESDTVDTLLKRADKALYHAKESGKNQFIVFNSVIKNPEEYRI